MKTKTRKPIRIDIRPDAYALFVRGEGYDLFVAGEFVGGFDTLEQATVYADRLLARVLVAA